MGRYVSEEAKNLAEAALNEQIVFFLENCVCPLLVRRMERNVLIGTNQSYVDLGMINMHYSLGPTAVSSRAEEDALRPLQLD